MMHEGFLAPTRNLDKLDPRCAPLNYVRGEAVDAPQPEDRDEQQLRVRRHQHLAAVPAHMTAGNGGGTRRPGRHRSWAAGRPARPRPTCWPSAGHDVLVLEKEVFPRFHIGESLLPDRSADLRAPGREARHRAASSTRTAPSSSTSGPGETATFLFDEALDGTPPSAYQVERVALRPDAAASRREARGAEVRDGVRSSASTVERRRGPRRAPGAAPIRARAS